MKFQKKCPDEDAPGRPARQQDRALRKHVLTIRDLCGRCIVLDKGRSSLTATSTGASLYLATGSRLPALVDYADFKRDSAGSSDNLRLQSVRIMLVS